MLVVCFLGGAVFGLFLLGSFFVRVCLVFLLFGFCVRVDRKRLLVPNVFTRIRILFPFLDEALYMWIVFGPHRFLFGVRRFFFGLGLFVVVTSATLVMSPGRIGMTVVFAIPVACC